MKLIEFVRGRPFVTHDEDSFQPDVMALDEYAVEAWERQTTLKPPDAMLVRGSYNLPFVVWLPRELWYKWYFEETK